MTTQEFISLHRNDNIRELALRAPKGEDIDMGFALDQIAGWQKARTKLPEWAAKEGIVYPPHISMEQCSSEATAKYKVTVAQRLMAELPKGAQTALTDLTGGFGVDFSYMAQAFGRATYVERQEHLCDTARHNMGVLGLAHAEVVCADAGEHLQGMAPATLVFIDPARRDTHGARTFAIGDCTPDVLGMKSMLLEKSDYVMVKLSPMLDWRKTVSDFGSCAGEVHIVSAGNECKELLIVISRHFNGLRRVVCVNDDERFSYDPATETVLNDTEKGATSADGNGGSTTPDSGDTTLAHTEGSLTDGQTAQESYLYEPNPSVMKAGCFALIATEYGVREVGKNSHLFLSERRVAKFPGRKFRIKCVTTMNKKELKRALGGIGKANIATRNFPMSVAELRKRLKTADGGDTYIFATTTADGTHVLMICEKTN